MIKSLKFIFLLVGALSMFLMSRHYFQEGASGILQGKAIAVSLAYRFVFLTHIGLGILAISLGPFQFLPSFLKKYPGGHRLLGYAYTCSVLLSSFSGFCLAPYSMGGTISAYGFSLLAVLWFLTILKAVDSARKGQIAQHRYWMYLNYGITFSAITQRTLLLLPLFTDVPFMPVYQLSAWLPWMFNLGLAHYFSTQGVVSNQGLASEERNVA